MNWIRLFFHNNMELIWFVYGLAFVLMGFSILARSKKNGILKFADILWLLAAFGLAHGIKEWLDTFGIIKGRTPSMDVAGWLLLAASYVFLLEFGIRILRLVGDGQPARRQPIGGYIYALITPVALGAALALSYFSADFLKNASIWTRYLLGFPGGILSGLGFLLHYRADKNKLETFAAGKYFVTAGIAFIVYGAASGLVVPAGDFFPANLVNTGSFYSIVGAPVQIFRGLCAIAVAWAAGGMLAIFDEERLRQINAALTLREKITEGIEEGIYLVDKNFRVIWANKKERDTYGEKIVGDYCYRATHGRQSVCVPPCDPCPVIESMKSAQASTFLHTHYDKDGEPVYIEVSAYPIKNADGEITEFVHVSRDVTEKTKMVETINSIGDPLVIISPRGHIYAANPFALELSGYNKDELLGGHAAILFSAASDDGALPSPAEEWLERIGLGVLRETGFVRDYESAVFTKSRSRIPVLMNASLVKHQGRLLGVVCVLRDLREVKKLQSQIFQATKLASVGELAAGTAHEIGNPLQTILGNVELLLAEDGESEELSAIKSASLQAKAVIGNLLDFARQREIILTEEDVNDVVKKTLAMYVRQLEARKIKVVGELSGGPLIVKASAVHLEQVFINIVANAKKAMPDGGTLWVTTKRSPTGVEISFKDTGAGISEETAKRLFEPFFTTRKDGNGLGLSVSYGIIKQHGGEITFFSEGEGKGAEFIVKLPAKFRGDNALPTDSCPTDGLKR